MFHFRMTRRISLKEFFFPFAKCLAASVCNVDSAVITSKTKLRLKSSTGFPFLVVLFRSVEIFYKHLSTRMKEFGFVESFSVSMM